MQNLIGQTITSRYRIDQYLGGGGMANVYQAWDIEKNTWFALKLLKRRFSY